MNSQLSKISFLLFIGIVSACSSSQFNVYEDNSATNLSNLSKSIYKPVEQSNESIDFYDFISGINSVVVITRSKFENSLNNDDEFQRKYYKLIKQYLEGIGIEHIALTHEEQTWIENNIPLENTAFLSISLDETKNYVSKTNMTFKSCNGDEFKFSSVSDYYIDKEWDEYLLEKMKDMFWERIVYNPEKRIPLRKEMTVWNRNSLQKRFDIRGTTELEGIYEKYGIGNSINELKYCIALVKEDEDYNIIYIDGANNDKNWTEGELKGTISKTSIKDFYKVKWIMSDKTENENVYMNTSRYNFLEFDFLSSEVDFSTNYLKIYPLASDKIISSNNYLASGTGFMISDAGHLVTNHHIIQGANKISIQVNLDNNLQEFSADVVRVDIKNDLAVLKISDSSFSFNYNIPYQICCDESPVGTSVFTMGYPMIETMGESLKLSDGIISSQSGYMANNSTYQITVPINPGNSGGPLFDKKGNLVGIINAKYTGAENVAYAIKSKVLNNLLDDLKINLPTSKSMTGNDIDLVENVQKLNNLVCLIKVYN